jgi:hypothetical protein
LTPLFASRGKVTKKWVHGNGEKTGFKRFFHGIFCFLTAHQPDRRGVAGGSYVAEDRLYRVCFFLFQVIQGKKDPEPVSAHEHGFQ